MKTYKQFISTCENIRNEEELEEGIRKRLAAAALGAGLAAGSGAFAAPSAKAVDWNAGVKFGRGTTAVYGGAGSGSTQQGGTAWNVRGELGTRTGTGQGDRINRGIDAAIQNYKTGNSENTSTSSGEKKVGYGSFSANVSGSNQKAAPPKPVTPKKKVKQEKELPKPPTTLKKQKVRPDGPAGPDAYQQARARMEKQGFTDAAGNAYTNATQAVNRLAGSPNAASRAQAAQAFRDLELLGRVNKGARLSRSSGIKHGTIQPDGSVTF